VVKLAEGKAQGVFNVVGPDRINRYQFALEAAEVFGLDRTLIHPVTTLELGQSAPRPLNAGLVCEKISAEPGIGLIGYREGLRLIASEI
jgi:dTDP-4-dehydrorhamnose reductase